ncbi:TetR/AcrR family transcriptional regulator [Oceanobacillus chungangensis]|uniref:TetR family transcriptional regulator n=1 Tax=Oceanobacillus chungangensis TaxID=1229152 RepID=A0A3D8PL25_9BACI|nr:TetR/AcrR family transcriptional regulator [Oceanobacillus chungangensis]RDW16187.1 TetR family transcriptional regulator [Oceanobacillus chungangensis]
MMKKQLIMDKALELFADQGFESTSVQQITEKCGISKGAFYLSFKSKDELISAMIDHFMEDIIKEIDRVVKNTNNEELLYIFYYETFQSFQKHSDFTKVLIKEQTHTINKEFLLKISYYNSLIEETILSMIERIYGDKIKEIKYDLLYCIKSFISIYSELKLFYSAPLDLQFLAESFVEKTNLLAKHTTIPLISEEVIQAMKHPLNEDVTIEKLLEIIEQTIDEMKESIEKESLVLLKEELIEPALSPAIIKGLIENVRNKPECKWISYLLQNYYSFS